IASCEFSGQLVKIDLAADSVVGYMVLDPTRWMQFKTSVANLLRVGRKHRAMESPSMPQDVRSSADGKNFYVADMKAGGVYVVDPVAFQRTGFIETGTGAHGIYPSRDGKLLYVTNRGWSTVSGGRRGPG